MLKKALGRIKGEGGAGGGPIAKENKRENAPKKKNPTKTKERKMIL